MSLKRARSINWSEEEKRLLVCVLRDYSHIIENKCQNTGSNKAKITAWEEVHKRFNELNSRPRELNQLQIQWKGMKIAARKNVSTNKKKVKGTGGGPRPESPNPGDIDIVDLLNPGELLRDFNIYDSDGSFCTRDSQLNILVENTENDSQVTLLDSPPPSNLVGNEENSLPSTSAIKTSSYNIPNSHLAKDVTRKIHPVKIRKTPFRNGRTTMLANTKVGKDQEYIHDILLHSKALKDAEHKMRLEMAEEEHKLKIKILNQNLVNSQIEGEILEFKKTIIEIELKSKIII